VTNSVGTAIMLGFRKYRKGMRKKWVIDLFKKELEEKQKAMK
jgi:hypothetical protein